MSVNDKARALVQRLESCRLEAYLDERGVWTIGWGHTGPEVRPGLSWTQAQADEALQRDLQRFLVGVQNLVAGAQLTENQLAALTSFAYNVGLVALAGSSVLKDIRAGRLDDVPRVFKLWNHVHQPDGQLVVSSNLTRRRSIETEVWTTP